MPTPEYRNDLATPDPWRLVDPNMNFAEAVRGDRGLELAAKTPYDLYNAYNKVARYGIYGKGGVDSVMRRLRLANMLRQRLRVKGLRQSQTARRLGPFSGALNRTVANSYAPMQAEEMAQEAGLISQNYASMLSGLGGQAQMIPLMMQLAQLGEQFDDPGLLDILGGLATSAADVAGAFGVGIPGQGSMARAATGGGLTSRRTPANVGEGYGFNYLR